MPNKYNFILLNLINELTEKKITCYLSITQNHDCLGNKRELVCSYVIYGYSSVRLEDEPAEQDFENYIEQIKAILDGAE